ncbi:MAG TPA: hypothetical protein VNJ04_20365 [Gemmatimonadaceae bacterium]|nr:hypothetical protein [Gemmatimonadaceae bacterium]
MADKSGPAKCRRKFLRFFRKGFHDDKYVDWERGYKWEAHEAWQAQLGREQFRSLLDAGDHNEIALRAVRLESRTNLLFSFEKIALRDAVKAPGGAKAFSEGLFDFVYGKGSGSGRFENWVETVAALPRRQTRVLTWPLVTVFGFIGAPAEHFFLKPMVTRAAAREYGYDFRYQSKPSWEVYKNLLEFAGTVSRDLRDLEPRDMIDIQSFLWVQGSDEYEE